jgi:hypothetical protein
MMAFVVLFSTMSFTIDMHFCGDTLVDSAIFKKAKNCGMDMQQGSKNKSCSITKKNCCSEKQRIVEGQDELQFSSDVFTFEQQQFVASFVYAYIYLLETTPEGVISYRDYVPPLVVRQIYKLDETYLI